MNLTNTFPINEKKGNDGSGKFKTYMQNMDIFKTKA